MPGRNSEENLPSTSPERKAKAIAKAFEIYFEMGPSRTLAKLSKKINVPFETLQDWSEAYAWHEKINTRNKDVDRAFEEYYKAKSRDIRNNLIEQIQTLLATLKTPLGLPFNITDVSDLKQLAQAYESLVRANTMALTKASSLVSKNEAPTTWLDLVGSIDGEVIEED